MPELPEVECIRRQLEPEIVGRVMVESGSHPSAKFVDARSTVGTKIVSSTRRGKFLIFGLADATKTETSEPGRELIIHLGMTGKLSIVEEHETDNDLDTEPYLRAWWLFDTGQILRFDDVRRFGRVRVVEAGDYSTIPTLDAAGPEPFDPKFTATQFWELTQKSKRKIKTQLLSQRPVAGVGNIYADEALWHAKINPKATTLSKARAETLLGTIRDALNKGLDNGGTTLRDYRMLDGSEGENQMSLKAYGRKGEPCLRCSTKMKTEQIDARTTTWCPKCQKH